MARTWDILTTWTGWRLALGLLGAAVGYAVLALIGKQMAFVGSNVSPIWPASAFALVVVWRGGSVYALGILAGSIFTNYDRMGSLAAVLVAGGTISETLIARALLRWGQVQPDLQRVRDILLLALFGGLIPALASSSVGATVICTLVATTPPPWLEVAWTWWSGDSIGAIMLAPVFLWPFLARNPERRSLVETTALLLALLGITLAVFGLPVDVGGNLTPLGYLCFPPLIWAAMRFGLRGTVTASLLVAVLAVLFTIFGFGPFAGFSELNRRLLALQSFLLASAMTSQVMAVIFIAKQKTLAALSDSQERYRLVSENTRDLVSLHALDGRYRWVSPSAKALLGWDSDTLIGRDPYDFYHPDDAARIRAEAHQPLIDRSAGILIEYRFKHHDGRWIWLESSAVFVCDPTGTPIAIQSISRDVSQRKMDEERLEQARRANLQADRMAALGTLAGGVAHEFNNLNAIILGNCELLLRHHQLEPDAAQRLTHIQTAAERSSSITRSLLDYARNRGPERGRADANNVVRSTLELAERTLSQRGVRTVVHYSPVALPVATSAGGLGQVLLNLLLNAADAVDGRSDGTITITLSDENGYALLQVADNGVGIPEAHLGQLFLPFFTTKGATATGSFAQPHLHGTGLGLAVCDTLIRHLHGRIEVASLPGEGTSFLVRLPLAEEAPAITSAEKHTTAPANGRPARILIIDDEDALRSLLSEQLRDAGHQVHGIHEGYAGLAYLRTEDVDLVLLDLHMPGLDGLGVLQRIAADMHRTWPPILILTGGDDRHLPEPPPTPVVGVLHKPLRHDDLVRAVRDALHQARLSG